jgi:hypothetical protein
MPSFFDGIMDHPTDQYLARVELSKLLTSPTLPPILAERLEELKKQYDLSSNSWSNPKNSPHVWLQLVGAVEQEYRGYYASRSIALDLVLRPEHPRRPWRPRGKEMRTSMQWGQRKLLLVEIEFLTRYGHLSDTVVYAGAARGDHIPTLAWLFPGHTFHLYDPSPAWYIDGPGIRSYKQLFLRADAERWSGSEVLFISDIVTSDSGQSFEENRVRQARDMAWQAGWVKTMRPAMALLRFALPWSSASITPESAYLAGELWLQPWTQPTSTETRLVTDGSKETTYNHLVYEEQLAHHNAVTRLCLHNYRLSRAIEGLDHCRDCAMDIAILRRYVSTIGFAGREPAEDDEQVAAILLAITQRLGNILTEVMDRFKTTEHVRTTQMIESCDNGVCKPVLAFEEPLQYAIKHNLG